MADNSIKIGIEAELQNYDKIVKYITDGIEKGLVDGVSDKALQKIANRLKTATEQLNLGNFDAALETLEKIGAGLLSVSESINVAAGAASSELSELTEKLTEAKRIKDELERNTPKGRYRELKDSQGNRTGHYVRAKAGLQHNIVGMATEEQWKSGQATFTGKNGQETTIDYGGKTWSINSAINALVKALNDGALVLNKEIRAAVNEFGYKLSKHDGVFSASREDLTTERETALQTWKTNVAEAQAKVTDLQLQVDEAAANVESVKITAETGEFTTPIKDIVAGQERSAGLQDEYNKSIQEEAKQQTLRSNAAEAARDAEDKLKQETKEATTATQQQTTTIGKAVTIFFGYQMVIRQLRKLWNEAIHTIKELDKQLTDQATVTNLTREQTWQLVATYQDLADQAGVTQTEIAGVTTEYLRQGETLENALALTKAATAAATVAGISASDSVRYLTTAIHGFKLEAEDALAVSDKFAALAAQAATNYEDLAVALSKVASQAALAGMSMDYTLALLTTGLDVTQEAPESIGTALKTVIARMREISDYGKTLEDNVNLNQVEAGLKAVGIQLRNGIGELRSTEDVLDELGRKWQDLSANQQAAVAKALAGTRQQSRLVAIMENYDDVLQNMAVSQNSLGATTAQQVKYLQGMEAAMNRMQNAYQSLIETLVKSDTVIGFINFITGALKNIQKFLSQPAGRFALVTGIMSLLMRSQQFLEKVRSIMGQLLQVLSQTRAQEEAVVQLRKKELTVIQQQLAAQAGLTETQLEKGGFGKTERPNGWLSNRPGESNFTDLLASLIKIGPGYKERVSQTWSSWNQNNSPWAKVSEGINARRNQNQFINSNIGDLQAEKEILHLSKMKELEQELANARELTQEATSQAQQAEEEMNQAMLSGDMSPEGLAATDNARRANEDRIKAEKEQLEIENRIAELREHGCEEEQDLQKQLDVLQSKHLSREEKIAYINNKELIAKKKTYTQDDLQRIKEKQARGEKLSAAEKEVLEKAKVVQKAEEEVTATENKASGKQTGQNFSTAVSAATGIASAAAGMVSMIQGMVETIQNRYKEIAENAINEATEIQSEIYNNTQTMTTLQNLTDNLKKLDRQVIKSADVMKQLSETREELLKELEINAADAKAYTNQQLYDKAMAKRAQLETKNNELLGKLGDTLLGAANNYDAAAGFGNILGKFAMGAGLGAAATGWMSAGGVTAIGTAIGTAVGAVIGGIVGIVEEIGKKMAADDAKGKVHEMLQSDEGVSQMQYYFKAMYKNQIDTTTAAGERLANSVKTTYASLMDNLNGEQIESLLNKYNWNVQDLADNVSGLLIENGDALSVLTSDTSNFQERVAAAGEIYGELAARSEELGKAFLQEYGAYVELGSILGDYVHYLDDYQWSLSSVNDLLSQLAEDGLTAAEAAEKVHQLGEAMKDNTLSAEELEAALGDMSHAARQAAMEMISSFTMQDIADQFTTAKNSVNNIRDTQAKWDTMSATDRQRFIDENEDFFNIEGAREAFYNGEDITKYLEEYKKAIQEDLLDTVNDKIAATEVELYDLRKQYKEAEAAGDTKQMELLNKRIKTTERNLQDLHDKYADVNSMFDLTLSEVVNKQNEQIKKLKEMYQAEEKALVDSLNKRKEAYQKYFDGLAKAESLEEYNQNRENLVNAIAKVGAGTDANSRRKVADLQRQLRELDKQEAQRQKEKARQAVLENIDTEISRIQDQFYELLKSDQALLDSMNENTHFQYLAYLAQSGQTKEAQDLAIKQMGDLLKGKWGQDGNKLFNDTRENVAAEVTTPTVSETHVDTSSNTFTIMNTSGEEQRVQLTEQQMRQLVSQLLDTVSRWTGIGYKH